MIELGSKAPNFSLRDQNGKTVKLSGIKEKKVLLSFRPLAWTPVCHDQMLALENNRLIFERLNTIPFGIGVDSAPSNKAWAQSMEIDHTRLLSDFWPHGEVSKAFGVFREGDGFSERANIIIDEKKNVVFARVYPMSQLPDFDEIMKFLMESK
jgi:peroxiredoxin